MTACKNLLSILLFANFMVAMQQATPEPCPHDAAGFAALQQRVDAKDPAAQMAMASCHDQGRHVPVNGQESLRLLTEAANQGYAPAEYELGRIYLYGRGIPADYDKALVWEKKAADKGDVRAQRDLALMYERGFGVTADAAQAAEWNRKAAGQGHAEAQAHLARALDQGAGVAKNPDEARDWYAKAAEKDHPGAQLELARKLAKANDCAGAIRWYTEAATHGQSTAMYELGKLYLSSDCGPDKNKAFMWLTIGARFGSKRSANEANTLETSLGAAQKKHAQQAAEQWIKDNPGSEKVADEDKP
jgi:hypothetical protein